LTQKGYLQKILQNFNINGDMKPVRTLLAPHFKLKATMSPTTIEKYKYMSHILYATAMDSLMYTMVCAKLDLLQVVSMVSRYMHIPIRVNGGCEVDFIVHHRYYRC